jgi:hypothetical protein
MKKVDIKRIMQNPITKAVMRPGIHNLPDEVFSHWFIQGMVENGSIVVINTAIVPPVLKPTQERKVVNPIVEEIKPQKVVDPIVEEIKEIVKEKEDVVEVKVEEVKTEELVKKTRKKRI